MQAAVAQTIPPKPLTEEAYKDIFLYVNKNAKNPFMPNFVRTYYNKQFLRVWSFPSMYVFFE